MTLPLCADAVVISVNPKAGRSSPMQRAELLRDSLQQKGFVVDLLTDLNEVAEKANSLQRESRLRALIGVGGDGTAAELVNRTIPGTPVVLLPAGTANLLARQLNYPVKPDRMARMIADGCLAQFDAGRANGRLFLAMISAGIDADIVRQVHSRREENFQKQTRRGAHISYCSYLGPVFTSLRNYSWPVIDMEFSDDLSVNSETEPEKEKDSLTVQPPSDHQKGRWVFIVNFARYGWGVSFTPKNTASDGFLDFCCFRRGGMIASIWNVLCAQLGGLHRFLPGTKLGRGRSFQLSGSSEIPYQLDGDFAGFLPVQVEVVPNRFTTIIPGGTAKI